MATNYLIKEGKRQADPKNHVTLTCEACGKPFTRYKSYLKKISPRAKPTCSKKCKYTLCQTLKDNDPLIKKMLDLYNQGLGAERVAKKLGIGRSVAEATLRRLRGGLRPRSFYKGEKSATYKGGYVDKQYGYKFISTGKYTRIAEHRKVMEDHLGRKLEKHEQVHHINGDKLDNRLENLMILTWSKHTKLHDSMRKQEIKILKNRIIELEKELNEIKNNHSNSSHGDA